MVVERSASGLWPGRKGEMASYRIICDNQAPVSAPKRHAHVLEVGVGTTAANWNRLLTLSQVLWHDGQGRYISHGQQVHSQGRPSLARCLRSLRPPRHPVFQGCGHRQQPRRVARLRQVTRMAQRPKSIGPAQSASSSARHRSSTPADRIRSWAARSRTSPSLLTGCRASTEAPTTLRKASGP